MKFLAKFFNKNKNYLTNYNRFDFFLIKEKSSEKTNEYQYARDIKLYVLLKFLVQYHFIFPRNKIMNTIYTWSNLKIFKIKTNEPGIVI